MSTDVAPFQPPASVLAKAFALREGPGVAQDASASLVEAAPRRSPAEVRLPCMVYAAVASVPPHMRSAIESAVAEARRAPGVVNALVFDADFVNGGAVRCGVALVARGQWLARQSLQRLLVQLHALGVLEAPPEPLAGDSEAGLARGTAHWVNGRLRLWHGTLDSARSRSAAARIAGLDENLVELRSAGRQDAAEGEAVLVCSIALARALPGTPVQALLAPGLTTHWAPEPEAAEGAPVLKVVGGSDTVAAAA